MCQLPAIIQSGETTMKAIWTKYIRATDTKGARVRAEAEGVRPLILSYWSDDNAHAAAALALARREKWTGTLIEGGRPDGKGDVFVFADARSHAI
jgi:hypothetical protein